MARKVVLSLGGLVELGAEKLATLILEETEANAAFAKRAKAALAGGQGVDVVTSLIDRRLSALERARGMVDWEKERGFAADLGAVVDTIVGELGQRSPFQAVQRLLRFGTCGRTRFEAPDNDAAALAGLAVRARIKRLRGYWNRG